MRRAELVARLATAADRVTARVPAGMYADPF
jgi:hypothetical protein